MTRRTWWRVAGAVAAVLVLAGGALAVARFRPRPAFNVAVDGLALAGYDPVSYFAEGGGRPQPGDPARTAMHDGRRYRFASDPNRQRFLASPERYEPAFGGWCTYAVANGYKFEVDPTSYLVEDGRLLLFYDGVFGDARASFTAEGAADGLARAERHWPGLSAQ